TFTPEQVDRAVRLLAHLPGAAAQAMARALNRALEGARTAAAKQTRAEYRVSTAAIKATMRLVRATASRLEAAVVSRGQRIPLFTFGPKPDQPGTGGVGKPQLRVGVKRAGGRKELQSAFVARVGRVARRKGKERFPLESLFGPAVPQMMHNEAVIARVEAIVQERLDARLDHEIAWALEKAAR
ncbi:MAG: hypothetical protein FJ125_06930, partial [Deltaproteobacteria bacterium]|nr:hypothetical protein [Deltaproteobacteria bacterium]